MKCRKCGNDIPNKVVYCPSCGNKVSNKLFLLIIPIILIIVLIVIILNKKGISKNEYSLVSSDASILTVNSEAGIPKFIDGTFTDIKVKDEDDAYKALDSLKDKLKFNDVYKEFSISSTEKNQGITYYKFRQKYQDVFLYKTDLVITVDKNNDVIGMSGYYIPNIDININQGISLEEAIQIVKNELGDNANILESNKYIYADYENTDLVYVIDGYSDTLQGRYIVDAIDKEIIVVGDLFDSIVPYEASINGIDGLESVTIEQYKDIKDENKYRLVDVKRNIQIVDGSNLGLDMGGLLLSFIFSSNSPMEGDLLDNEFIYKNNTFEDIELARIGVTTLRHFEKIYDYYLNVLGRKSYDNKNSKTVVNIGLKTKTFGDEQLENAAWGISDQMYIGYWNNISFSKSLDVLAHEFTHGVISYTADFASIPKKSDMNKAFETGSLNEAYADILGSLIEGENWVMNDSIESFRSLEDPALYGDAVAKGGENYYPDAYLNGRSLEEFLKENNFENIFSYDGGGKHHNSTVLSHAAYLMEDYFRTKEDMAKVWYNSLFLLSSYSNFEDAALAVIKSAKDLGYDTDDIHGIRNAFVKVNILKNKEVTLSGKIYSKGEKIANAKIEILSDLINYDTYTDKDGNYSIKIHTGNFELKVTKDGFKNYVKDINIIDNTQLDIELASSDSKMSCDGDKCHTLTIYYLDSVSSSLDENYQTFQVSDGEKLGTSFIEQFNKILGDNMKISSDGETFKMSLGELSIDFAWYYLDSDEKFDFNKPIHEDVSIEMRMINGLIDNDTIKDIYDIFN